jgi:conjugal transfer pilus assembly protein TraW
MKFKPNYLLATVLLCTHITATATTLHNLGVWGELYPIAERNLLDVIKERLDNLQQSGELNKLQQSFIDKAKQNIARPKASFILPRATKSREYFISPSVTATRDILGANHEIIVPHGTKVNPLEFTSLPSNLIFFDGDDKAQVKFVRQYIEEQAKNQTNAAAMPILINGSIIELMQRWNMKLYFDQGGYLTSYFKLQQVPAIVTQRGMQLMVQEKVI